MSRNNRGLNGIYLVFSMVFLIVIFLLVVGYALDVSGLMKDRQEEAFSMLLAHRVGNSFDVSRRNGVATTSIIASDAYLFGIKRVRLDVSGSGNAILINASVPVQLPATGRFRLEGKDGFYVLEVFG